MDTGKIAFCEGNIYLFKYGSSINEFERIHIMGDMIEWVGYFEYLGPWNKSIMFKRPLRFSGRLTAG